MAVFLLWLLIALGGIALVVALYFFRQASYRRKQGRSFVGKAGYAFFTLLLSALLFLCGLLWFAHFLGSGKFAE